MSKVYINGTGCISAQSTFDGSFLENISEATEGYILPVVPPVYKEYISPGMIRRMGSGVKNGVVASSLALKEAGNPELDAIITGTGVGCIKDSESFLTAIIENNEEFLTPTAFIQSTHNTVGGQIALGLGCKAYNFSYVQAGASFESALFDAHLQLVSDEANTILVGGVDERADRTYKHFELAGLIKTDENSVGATYSEGATFFVLGSERISETYAELKGAEIINRLGSQEIGSHVEEFLKRNGTDISSIDVVIVGKSDDKREDVYYDSFLELFDTPSVYYKHLSGEYNTSSAFGFWVGVNILKRQIIPESTQLNKKTADVYQNVLLYNQYQGLDHSFVLLSRC